nr:hypothetical protein [Tanacetum cinerariifolium]
MGRETIQLENAISTISQEYLLEFTSGYGIPESLHPEFPGPSDPIVEFPEGKVGVYTKFFKFVNFRSSGTPSTVEKSPLDFSNEDPPLLITERIRTEEQGHDELSQGILPGNPPYTEVAPEPDLEKETVAMGSLVNKTCRKRGPDEAKANAPPKVLRKDHVASHLSQKTPVHVEGVCDPDSLSHAKPPPALEQDIAQSSKKAVATKDHDSEKSTSFTSMVGSPGSIYQPGNHQLSQQVSTLQAQVTGEERIKATFEEFKKYEDNRVFTDVVSAGIAKGISERLKHGVEYEKSKVDLAAIEEYEPEVDTKYVVALHVLKDLKYPLVDQLEKLKDAPIDVIMSSLYLESDYGEDTPQWIRELHPSSSQLKTPVYPEDLAYGKVSEATDQALGLLKVNFVPTGLVSISPTPNPSAHDDPSINSVHGLCGVLITDAFGEVSSGFSVRKSARIWPFTYVRGRLASFSLRLWTSLIVRGDRSYSTSFVLSGHGFIPSRFIMYSRNILFAAPNVLTNLFVKSFVYQLLVCGANVLEAKGHFYVAIYPVTGMESRLFLILLSHLYLMIAFVGIQETLKGVAAEGFDLWGNNLTDRLCLNLGSPLTSSSYHHASLP